MKFEIENRVASLNSFKLNTVNTNEKYTEIISFTTRYLHYTIIKRNIICSIFDI